MIQGDTHFIEEFGETLKASCHQNEPPFCEVACPFHLPVREMQEKWAKGRAKAVYRTYQNGVAFPAIVSRICSHPCEKMCPMAQRGGAISLGKLEQATIRLTKRTKPNAYNMPPKAARIAIVGAGLAGLGCALRLCNKKYQVTIFEESDQLGGSARALMDPELFDEEIRNQFSEEHPEIRRNERIEDVAALRSEYDAVFVAVGRGGEELPLTAGGDGAFASQIPGVFFGGEMAGAPDPVFALAEGLRASLAVERYLKTGLMNEPFDDAKSKLIIDSEFLPVLPAVLEADPKTGYSEAEVIEEASRCQRCSCDICTKACDLMRIQEKTPNRLYEEAYITVRPSTLANDGRWATRRIASCDQCGLCKTVCPQDIDMGKFLMQSHRGLKDSNAMPWAFHDFWLRDLEFSVTEAAVVIRHPGTVQSRTVFFPGCQYGASDPEMVKQIAGWLWEKQPDAAVWLNCCGAPAVWAAEDEWQEEHVKELRRIWEDLGKPVILFACPSCRKMFERYLPDLPMAFLEEKLLEWGLPELDREKSEVQFRIFDPCAGREHPELAESVRQLASMLGVTFGELPYHGKTARCCSFGGQYSIASPDYAKRVRMERAEESPDPYITSCINCRDTFAGRGKENLHILDLVFGRTDRRRETPTVTERRENRMKLKADLRREICGETTERRAAEVKMICDRELEKSLSARHILLTDMEEVIAHCEREQIGILDAQGRITGHRKIGHMTFWAVYEPLDDGSYRLWQGYAHRMNLEGE